MAKEHYLPSGQNMLNWHQNGVTSWHQLTTNHRSTRKDLWRELLTSTWHQLLASNWYCILTSKTFFSTNIFFNQHFFQLQPTFFSTPICCYRFLASAHFLDTFVASCVDVHVIFAIALSSRMLKSGLLMLYHDLYHISTSIWGSSAQSVDTSFVNSGIFLHVLNLVHMLSFENDKHTNVNVCPC